MKNSARFTERASGAIAAARDASASLGHSYVGTEHLLLGVAAALLSGIAAISLMKLIAKKSKFGWFAYYCWGAGVLTIIFSLIF